MSILVIVVLVLAATAVGVALLSVIAEKRHPPTGRFIECGGNRVHYVERGPAAAPAVVVFHGNGAMIQDIASSGLLDLLSTRFRVVCFDRPGFGYSTRSHVRRLTPELQADLFAAVLARLGVRDPVVVGHSWGTLVALALALRGKLTVRGMVLAAGYYFPTRRFDVWIAAAPALPILGEILRYTIAPVLGWILGPPTIRRLFAPRPVPDRFRAEFPLALALRPKHLRSAAEEMGLMVPAVRRLQALYPNLSCPTELFCAAHDTLIEPDQGPRLHRVLAGSVLHLVPDAGHMLHHAVPDEIAAAVARVSAPRRAGDAAGALPEGDPSRDASRPHRDDEGPGLVPTGGYDM